MTKTEEQMRAEFEAGYGLYDSGGKSDMDDMINNGNFRVWQACQRKNDAEITRLREALDKSNNRMYSVLTTHAIHSDVGNRIKERIDANKRILKGENS